MRERPKGPAPAVRHLEVTRTARYVELGTAGPEVRHVWFVLHGYGQLAADFAEGFAPLAGPRRLVVAPEALSRFYAGRGHDRVGASWMTREDREYEIRDYVAYLDAVRGRVMEGLGQAAEVHVVGFSQGCETAARWVAFGDVAPRSLVLWGGRLPEDLDLDAHRAAFAALRLAVVAGTRDAWATPERVAELHTRLDAHGLPYAAHAFDGGHRLDDAVLRGVVEAAEQV